MITVRRSDTGSFVLVHEPSQTVMVGEALDATYARMQEHLRDHPSLPPATVAAAGGASPWRAWLVGLGVLAVLPFLWLGVLHYTLGRMIDELRAAPAPAASSEEIEQLRSELGELQQVVSRVEDEVGRAREGRPVGTPRATRSRRVGERSAADSPGEPEPKSDARDALAERRRKLAEAKVEPSEPSEP